MVSDDRLVSYTTLLALEARGLCTGCEQIHFFTVLLHPQAFLPVSPM